MDHEPHTYAFFVLFALPRYDMSPEHNYLEEIKKICSSYWYNLLCSMRILYYAWHEDLFEARVDPILDKAHVRQAGF